MINGLQRHRKKANFNYSKLAFKNCDYFLRNLPKINDTTATKIIVPISAGNTAMPPKCQPQSPSSQEPNAEPTIPAIILPKIPPGIS